MHSRSLAGQESSGFQSTVGLLHDGSGQLRKLDHLRRKVCDAVSNLPKPFYNSALYNRSYENLVQGRPNDWHCRAGSRYLYVCEDGLVRYCSQHGGYPGIPLEEYTREDLGDLRREYATVKPCAPYCSIPCVQRVAMVDEFREGARMALARFFLYGRIGARQLAICPRQSEFLTWLFLPPNKHGWRRHLTSGFTRVASSCLRVE